MKQEAKKHAPKPPKAVSAVERTRVAHNSAVKADVEAAAKNRAAFFNYHKAIVEEFGGIVPKARGLPEARGPVDVGSVAQPKELNATMRPYQLEGLRFLRNAHENGISAILGDEMGLGKTLQTIAFLAHLKFEKKLVGPSLVIAPLSVLSSWLTECKKFCPQLRVVKLHSSDSEERERLKDRVMNDFMSFDLVVTTYEMAKSVNMQPVTPTRIQHVKPAT